MKNRRGLDVYKRQPPLSCSLFLPSQMPPFYYFLSCFMFDFESLFTVYHFPLHPATADSQTPYYLLPIIYLIGSIITS